MDGEASVQSLKDTVKKFCDERDWDQFHSPKELAIGVITEASELLEHFRFKTDKEIAQMLADPKKRESISEEMADTLYFLLRMSQLYEIDLSEAFTRKMSKNEKNYPLEKTKGKNVKYTEL